MPLRWAVAPHSLRSGGRFWNSERTCPPAYRLWRQTDHAHRSSMLRTRPRSNVCCGRLDAWKSDAPKLAQWAEENLPEGFTVFDLRDVARSPAHDELLGTHQSRDHPPHPRRADLAQHHILLASRLGRVGRVRRGVDDRNDLSQLEGMTPHPSGIACEPLQNEACAISRISVGVLYT